MVIDGLGHLPRRGEVYTHGRYAFRVQQADSRRIHTLQRRMCRPPPADGVGYTS
jgi:Mg2+/Co2+ transporter CorC